MELSLRIAGASGGEGCQLCGCWVEFDAGPVITLANSWSVVCVTCGLTHEPSLVVAQSLLQATEELQGWVGKLSAP